MWHVNCGTMQMFGRIFYILLIFLTSDSPSRLSIWPTDKGRLSRNSPLKTFAHIDLETFRNYEVAFFHLYSCDCENPFWSSPHVFHESHIPFFYLVAHIYHENTSWSYLDYTRSFFCLSLASISRSSLRLLNARDFCSFHGIVSYHHDWKKYLRFLLDSVTRQLSLGLYSSDSLCGESCGDWGILPTPKGGVKILTLASSSPGLGIL